MTEVGHEEFEMLMMRVIDGEADGRQQARFARHVAGCATCAAEYRGFADIKLETDTMRDRIVQAGHNEPVRDEGLARAAVGGGYALLLLGAVVLLGWWGWVFFGAPDVPPVVKYGVGGVLAGMFLLLLRVVMSRVSAQDPYKEIDR